MNLVGSTCASAAHGCMVTSRGVATATCVPTDRTLSQMPHYAESNFVYQAIIHPSPLVEARRSRTTMLGKWMCAYLRLWLDSPNQSSCHARLTTFVPRIVLLQIPARSSEAAPTPLVSRSTATFQSNGGADADSL